MIGRLTGIVEEKQAPNLLLDVSGVGYEVQAPMTTFFLLPQSGEQVTLYTHFAVSETSQQLYGFVDVSDRNLFRLLIKVSGVGPKMAISIMSMTADELARCVTEENVANLVKVPGVGKKTAERLIVEMRDKLKAWTASPAANNQTAEQSKPGHSSSADMIGEAESALVALGYKPTEAAKSVSAVMSEDIKRSEELIRLALKNMMPSS